MVMAKLIASDCSRDNPIRWWQRASSADPSHMSRKTLFSHVKNLRLEASAILGQGQTFSIGEQRDALFTHHRRWVRRKRAADQLTIPLRGRNKAIDR